MFPAWVQHSVEVNTCKKDRISISFNAIWKLYNQKKITLEVAVELLSVHDRSKEKKLWKQ